MKLTAKGRCAIIAMITLSMHSKRLSIKEIASEHDLSVRYLEQIFSLLKKSKLVNGTIGPSGGYMLEKTSDQISLKEIIDATEGVHDFSNASKSQDLINQIMDQRVFHPLDTIIAKHLELITLESLVKDYTNQQIMYYI